LPSSPG